LTADILCDRKAILSNGVVRCVGSSLFLKTRFGVGYSLNVVKSNLCNVGAVLSYLQRHVASVEQVRNVGAEAVFSLPYSSTHSFAALFEDLNKNQTSLGIASYGLSMTSLEEVFLGLQHDLDELNDNAPESEQQSADSVISEDNWQISHQPLPASGFTKASSVLAMTALFHILLSLRAFKCDKVGFMLPDLRDCCCAGSCSRAIQQNTGSTQYASFILPDYCTLCAYDHQHASYR
jgi:ATP-binding cassette, subfamily A (ABC1), member 5